MNGVIVKGADGVMKKSTKQLMEEFRAGKYQELLRDIYIDEGVLEYQKERYIGALQKFEELFGEKEVEIYSAPGRSEVGGNHTDHQHGKVLATSLNLDVIAVVSKTEDNMIQMKSEGYRPIKVELASLNPVKEEEGTSAALIRGVAAGLQDAG